MSQDKPQSNDDDAENEGAITDPNQISIFDIIEETN